MLNSNNKHFNSSPTIVFIDAGVDNPQQLLQGVIPSAQVFILDKTADGIEQISQVLSQYQHIDAVHIISHGAPGCLSLGNTQLSLDTLIHYAPQLQQWNVTNLLLYGCNVAAGDAGEEFIAKLHALTGSEIAASKSLTGSAAKGGNWELEVTTRTITAPLALQPEVMATYSGVMAIVLDTEPNDSIATAQVIADSSFTLDSRTDIQNIGGTDISTTVPHATITGTGDGSYDYYQFNGVGGQQFIFDIDDNNFDSVLELYDSNENLIGNSDDSQETGNTGNSLASFITSTLPDSGSYVIKVRAAGGNPIATGLSYTLHIVGVPSAPNPGPTDLDLSNTKIDENVPANSNIGTLTSTDPDIGETFTYSLVDDLDNYPDNGAFTIVGDQLNIKASPDFEDLEIYNILVQTTDSTGLTYEEVLTIDVNDVNEAPTDLTIDNSSINENLGANSPVGTFTGTDPDTGETFTYSLVAGTGDTDNDAFTIAGDELQLKASADYETQSLYRIRVEVADSGTNTYQKSFLINVNNINDAPTDLTLSSTSINENVAAGTQVGLFNTTDVDSSKPFTYSLVAGEGDADNGAFTVVNNKLLINASPDFETQDTYEILVQTTDAGGESYEEALTININDVNENLTSPSTGGTLNGTSGSDNINGSAVVDILYGNAGNDEISSGDGNDIVYGGIGDDEIYGGNGSDRLYGDAGNDQVYGDLGNDIIYGGDGDDLLDGGAGNDIIYGGDGDDLLDGGVGNDQLYGNAGIDTFVIGSGTGLDSIYKFENDTDKIQLDGLTFGELLITPSGTNTLIKLASTKVTLASLQNINSSLIDANDFITVGDP